MITNLRFYILPGRYSPESAQALYRSAYATFNSHWTEALQEIFGSDFAFFSNDFTRQDHIQALFLGDTCIALDCVREIDLKNPADLDDSWFGPWNKNHLIRLSESGYRRCLVNSYFTVHRDFRKTVWTQHDLSVSYVMGCLSVLHQLELGFPLMFGMMRNNRSMHALGKTWGSETVETNIIHNKTPSDLVVFTEQNVKQAKKTFPQFVLDIFDRKTDFTSTGEQNGYAKAA